ncbi:helix-turn-helix transcriptional regulator [Arthrobacter sp. 92]|uniref:helix-turn-helix transcriptional regulator n=1 Tax=Arthrobacter sp. 92 TaxID=3418175 RepID=UPI003CFD860C
MKDKGRKHSIRQNIAERGGAMDDVEGIAAGIRRARKDAGITQADLAHLAGTSERTIRAIETGTGNPSLAALVAVANVLGLHLTVR